MACPPLATDFDAQVRPCIDLIDRLRLLGLDSDFSLPVAVVIGDQSSGKSSVLEALSGMELPRGVGVVTRCPLELRMKCSSDPDFWSAEIRYKLERKMVKRPIATRQDVGVEVLKAQKEITGNDNEISDQLITLEVESANIPDLTLIDLPGIVRNVAEGQPQDISQKVRSVIRFYIDKPETILLVVVPANVDIATIEALNMAKEVDPEGKRTLGVITKTDIIDRGTEYETMATATNQRYKLRKGYILVKCRGQQDIANGKTLKEALADEREHFNRNEHFRKLNPCLYGVPSLAHKVTHSLVDHIKHSLPELKSKIRINLQEINSSLSKSDRDIPTDDKGKKALITKLTQRFINDVRQVSNGHYEGKPRELRLLKNARKEFDLFAETMYGNQPRMNDQQLRQEIGQEMDEYRGSELKGFVRYEVAREFIRAKVSQYYKPARECLSKVDEQVGATLSALAAEIFGSHPKLETEMKYISDNLRSDIVENCSKALEELFEEERLVYTWDHTFVTELERWFPSNGLQPVGDPQAETSAPEQNPDADDESEDKVSPAPDTLQQKVSGKNWFRLERVDKRFQTETLHGTIKTYLEVAVRRLADTVPTKICYHLLQKLPAALETELPLRAAQPNMTDLFGGDAILKKQQMVEQKECWSKALQEIENFHFVLPQPDEGI